MPFIGQFRKLLNILKKSGRCEGLVGQLTRGSAALVNKFLKV